ncbi:MAG: PilZ domain-containing protein [bacterium]
MATPVEKRKYPRVDTSRDIYCRIKVFGINARPLECQVINLSLGGVAFVSHWQNIAKAAKKIAARVQIQLPNGVNIDANTTLLRVRPRPADEQCICVYELTEMNKANASRLKHFVPR